MNPLLALIAKELRVELRSRQALFGSLLLALLILLAFKVSFLAIEPRPESRTLASGVIWAAVIFSGLGLVGHSFNREVDRHTLEVLGMAPLSKAQLYLGKLAGNLLLLWLVEAVIALAYVALFPPNPFSGHALQLAMVLILGGLGFATVGTLMASIASSVPGAWVLLPLLVVPLLIRTVLEMAVNATTYLTTGELLKFEGALGYLALYDVAFLAAGLVMAEYTL